MIVTVVCGTSKTVLEYSSPVRLDNVLADSGVIMIQPCAGKGKCGKCIVYASGVLSDITEKENELLSLHSDSCSHGSLNKEETSFCFTDSDDTAPLVLRLACCTYALGDAYVEYEAPKIAGITEGLQTKQAKTINPLSVSDEATINNSATDNFQAVRFGAAFDIGTTTVAASLLDLETGERFYSVCELNAQARFGADVLSRIEYAASGGLSREHEAIADQIDKICTQMPHQPQLQTITGNTTMLHLYEGLPVNGLAAYPFVPASLFGTLKNNSYTAPCIGAFVGADITCAILASGMIDKNETSVLLDIGTNGEMAFYSDNKLLCCSTAAGPAFEGAGISCGMTASDGAIDKVYIASSKVEYRVIGEKKAVGIAGSGLIDAIACMLDLDEIDETGLLEETYYIGDSGIGITPEDVRSVQLAKAAIRAGLDTLCGDYSTISKFYIAGGFGSRLNLHSCIRIGLLPREIVGKAVILGNAALSGAEMLLLHAKNHSDISELTAPILERAQCMNLAEDPLFTQKYIENMHF